MNISILFLFVCTDFDVQTFPKMKVHFFSGLKLTTAQSVKLRVVIALRGDFLENRVLGAQNQSDARMRI